MTGNTTSDQELADVRLLYNVSTSDIAFFKRQQWAVTNYLLLLYAALVAIGSLVVHNAGPESGKFVLAALGLAACVAGIVVTKQINDSIAGRRERLVSARAALSEKFFDAWDSFEKTPNHVYPLLISIQAIGGMLTMWILCALL